jgi:uncharacterized membrane protein YoaK (UPF0700 family)
MAPTTPLAIRQLAGHDPRDGPLPALLLVLTVVTASLAGQLIARLTDRAALLGSAASIELVLVVVACVVCAAVGAPFSGPARDVVAALLAVGMGVQNAVGRRLAVPELTTTVLTMTLTGIAADVRSRSYGPVIVRRLVAVAAMLGGAVLGAGVAMRHPAAWRKGRS